MKIIEKFVKGKNLNQELCEDGIFENENFVLVVDGATSKSNREWQPNKKSGKVARDIVLETMNDVPFDTKGIDLFNILSSAIRNIYSLAGEKQVKNQDKIVASIIVYSKFYNEIWSYGDCQAMVNKELHTFDKYIDKVNADYRSLVDQILLKCSVSKEEIEANDFGRKIINFSISHQEIFAGDTESEFGYCAVNGDILDEHFLKIVKCKKGDEIVLASDGYPNVKYTLLESELELERLLKNDPLCIFDYKSTHGLVAGNLSYDDRCYIRFIAE